MDDRREEDYSLIEPKSGPPGQATPRHIKRDADTVGESAGGFLGGVTGMSLGAMAGPVGLVIGGIAGAVGGWWAGRGIADAMTKKDDDYFRRHFEQTPEGLADRGYESVRPAYIAGHLAGRNPDYAGRTFEDIEADLRCGWNADVVRQCADWPAVRGYARAAFDRARKE
jgi:hypothetical protein